MVQYGAEQVFRRFERAGYKPSFREKDGPYPCAKKSPLATQRKTSNTSKSTSAAQVCIIRQATRSAYGRLMRRPRSRNPRPHQLTGNETVQLSDGRETNIRTALIESADITQNTPAFVQQYAELSNNEELKTIAADKAQLDAYLAATPPVGVLPPIHTHWMRKPVPTLPPTNSAPLLHRLRTRRSRRRSPPYRRRRPF